MVYCGKPSKGCGRCRARRIKCDQVRPSCGQCNKAQKPCPGYRELSDLIFRNESENVIQKYRTSSPASATTNKSAPSTSKPDTTSNFNEALQELLSDGHLLSQGVAVPITQIATTFLLSTYVAGSHFAYLPELHAAAPPNGLLSSMTDMIALASFAHEMAQPSILDLARKTYDQSLMQLASSLRDPIQASKDDTLASIQLLTLYEHLSNDSGCAINYAWGKHAVGALSILQLRGHDHFNRAISRALFKQASDNIVLYCIQDRIEIPQNLLDLKAAIDVTNDTTYGYDIKRPSWNLYPITAAFCTYRASWIQTPNGDSWSFISEALAIDEAAEQYALCMPNDWQFQTVPNTELELKIDKDLAFRNTVHIYSSHYTAQIWNAIRMIRVTLHESILTHVTALEHAGSDPQTFSQLKSLRTTSEDVLKRQCEEICSSVSQWLVNSEHRQSSSIAAGYLVVWPLFVAARGRPDICKDFAIKALKWLGKEFRIRSAAMAAEKLENNAFWEGWLHVCYTF